MAAASAAIWMLRRERNRTPTSVARARNPNNAVMANAATISTAPLSSLSLVFHVDMALMAQTPVESVHGSCQKKRTGIGFRLSRLAEFAKDGCPRLFTVRAGPAASPVYSFDGPNSREPRCYWPFFFQ